MKQKRTLLILILLCAVFMLLPVRAQAYEATGQCGTNLTWTLDSDGKLTISGTGDMYNTYSIRKSPWGSSKWSVKTVEIRPGITELCSGMFAECTNLTSVDIPDTVVSIGKEAFYNCKNLTEVKMGNSVTSLGISAFERCGSLHTVILSEKITKIEERTFYACWELKNMRIPSGVRSIAREAFVDCISLTEVDIPNGITTIPYNTFHRCTKLVRVGIPASVTEIGQGAFEFCAKLSDVTIPESVTTIGERAFSGTGIRELNIPGSVQSIGAEAFAACRELTSVTIPSTMTSIPEYMFTGCVALKSIVIPDSVSRIENSAFQACSSLSVIVFPQSITRIRSWAFRECTGLKQIYFLGNPPSMDSDVFQDVTAEAYYPQGNQTWRIANMLNYKGNLTWKPCVPPLNSVMVNKVVAHATGNILYWDAVKDADLYQVYRLTSGSKEWTLIKNTRSLAYKDESAQLGVKYYYKVRARNGDRMSSMDVPSVYAVRPMGNVKMTGITAHHTGIIIRWDAVYSADLYQIYRRGADENAWTLIKNTRSLAYKDESALREVKYYYKVRARNGNVMSSLDITALSAVRPYPLDSVKMTKAIGHATGNIIYWEAVEDAALYQVYRRASNESSWTLLKNTGSLAYKDTEAQSGVKYYYKVVARNGEERSSMNITAISATRP